VVVVDEVDGDVIGIAPGRIEGDRDVRGPSTGIRILDSEARLG